MTDPSPFALPRLKEVFEALRRGRHLCPEDGDLYWALHDHRDAYQDLLSRLGFRLAAHPRGFFYVEGEGSLSDASARMALFLFVLIEHLADQGAPVEEGLMTRTFALADLPHLASDRYRAYLKEAGAEGEEGLEGIVRNLERFGFAQRTGGGSFRFRTPAYRFLDLCHRVLADAPDEAPEGGEAAP
ncbi:MAG: condensin complex protein MksE [Deferrisomatales bacterium]